MPTDPSIGLVHRSKESFGECKGVILKSANPGRPSRRILTTARCADYKNGPVAESTELSFWSLKEFDFTNQMYLTASVHSYTTRKAHEDSLKRVKDIVEKPGPLDHVAVAEERAKVLDLAVIESDRDIDPRWAEGFEVAPELPLPTSPIAFVGYEYREGQPWTPWTLRMSRNEDFTLLALNVPADISEATTVRQLELALRDRRAGRDLDTSAGTPIFAHVRCKESLIGMVTGVDTVGVVHWVDLTKYRGELAAVDVSQ